MADTPEKAPEKAPVTLPAPRRRRNPPPESGKGGATLGEAVAGGYIEKHERTEITDLPRWVRTALVQHITLDWPLERCARHYGKKVSTLQKYACSPAAKQWKAELTKFADDPKAMAEATLKASAMQITLDYMKAYQSAMDAGDYKEVGVVSRDILDRIGMVKKDTSKGGQQRSIIHINLGQGVSLDVPFVETSFEGIVEGEYTEVNSDSEQDSDG